MSEKRKGNLSLTLKEGESFTVGEDVEVVVVKTSGRKLGKKRVIICVSAPIGVEILRTTLKEVVNE